MRVNDASEFIVFLFFRSFRVGFRFKFGMIFNSMTHLKDAMI